MVETVSSDESDVEVGSRVGVGVGCLWLWVNKFRYCDGG